MLLFTATLIAQKKATTFNSNDYASFGDKFKVTKVLTKKQMLEKYKTLKKGDTITVQFVSNIKAVCKKKGCWMKMELAGDDEEYNPVYRSPDMCGVIDIAMPFFSEIGRNAQVQRSEYESRNMKGDRENAHAHGRI